MRAVMIGFALIVILSLIVAPWVAITPTDFLPDMIQQVLDIADAGLRRLAPAPIPDLLALLETITSLSPLKMLLTGFLNPWMWIVILAPFLVAAVTLLMLLPGWALGSEALLHWSACVAACGGSASTTLLIVGMPAIEYLGLDGVYLARLGLALAGIHLTWGYWLTLVAVLGLTVAGALCLANEKHSPRKKSASVYGRPGHTYRR